MGLAIDTISATITNAGSTVTAAVAASGDSLTVRSFGLNTPAYIENMWRQGATAGIIRVRSPRLHDNVKGIHKRALANDPSPLFSWVERQRLYPQDLLVVEGTGGATEVEVAILQIYYTDLPGVDAVLRDWATIEPLIANLFTVEVGPTVSGTAGAWADRALNADEDLTKANTWYAILGAVADTRTACVAVKGPDLGNLRVGLPGTTTRIETRDYFLQNARMAMGPFIPVFNSANRGNTFVSVASDATTGTVNIDLQVAELTAKP